MSDDVGPGQRISTAAGRHRAMVALPADDAAPAPAAPGPRRRSVLTGSAVALALVLVLLVVGALTWSSAERPPDIGAAGEGHWVSTQGQDQSPGTPDRPWRTIAHAVRAAPAGSTIFVRDGTYEPFTVDRPGLRISSAPGERATVEGRAGVRDVVLVSADNVTVTDLTVSGCVPNPRPNVNVTGDHGSGIRIHRTRGVAVRGVTVRDSHGVNAAGLRVGCYGILATESRNLTVASSEVFHNGGGIAVTGGGSGVLVEGNNVHDQDVILHNTEEQLDDFGGYGLAATFITDRPGPVFRGNTVVRNVGPSTDYEVDGGGMEIYDAANTTVTGNTFAGNDGVVETGTGRNGRCADNVFTGNTVSGRSAGGGTGSTGLVLRCASNMVVRDNTFTELERFTFLCSSDGPFAGSIDGLQIAGNTVVKRPDAVVYRMQFGSARIPPITVDGNRFRAPRDRFAVIDQGSERTVSFDAWQSESGYDRGSTLS